MSLVKTISAIASLLLLIVMMISFYIGATDGLLIVLGTVAIFNWISALSPDGDSK